MDATLETLLPHAIQELLILCPRFEPSQANLLQEEPQFLTLLQQLEKTITQTLQPTSFKPIPTPTPQRSKKNLQQNREAQLIQALLELRNTQRALVRRPPHTTRILQGNNFSLNNLKNVLKDSPNDK